MDNNELSRSFNVRLMRFRPSDLRLALSRFYTARRAFGWLQSFIRPPKLVLSTESLFPDVNVAHAIQALHKDAIFTGFNLPRDEALVISEFAENAQLKHESLQDTFDVQHFRANIEKGVWQIPLAHVASPLECLSVVRVQEDPKIREIAASYLGYEPMGSEVRIWYSAAGDFDIADRRKFHQTIDYHYDASSDRMNFFFVSFYLSDVELDSGPHALILGSHRDKPLRWCFGAARRTEQAIFLRYSPERERVLTGPMGTGFLEDASCFHRALAPTGRERLMMQIRIF